MTDQHASAYTLVSFRNSQGTEAIGTLLKLARTTVVFEVYNPYSVVQLSEVLQELSIKYGNRLIYNGRAVVSNLVNTGLMLVVSVTLVDPWSDLTDILNNAPRLHEEVENFIDDWQKTRQLRPGYQLAVGKLRSFLTELNRWLEQLEVAKEEYKPADQSLLSQECFTALSEPIMSKSNGLFVNFEQEACKIPESELINHKMFAQQDLHPLMMRSPFFHRSYYKPLGYAGDYEMVNMMLRDSREGPTIYSQFINTYFHLIGPTKAHRNRIDILIDYLTNAVNDAVKKDRVLRVLNIGCGPAVEIQRFIRSQPLANQCRFRLIDFNQETLDYAKTKIGEAMQESGRKPEIEYINQSVHSLLKLANKKNNVTDINEFDLVYCAGLFDYLSDKVCSRLLRLFYQWTKPGGMVLATNVHPDNPSRWTMEHVVEWYLIHRDDQQMLGLVPDMENRKVFMDQTGLNVFLTINKIPSQHV